MQSAGSQLCKKVMKLILLIDLHKLKQYRPETRESIIETMEVEIIQRIIDQCAVKATFYGFLNTRCKQVLLHCKKDQLAGTVSLIKICIRLSRLKILILRVNRVDIDTVAVGIMKVKCVRDMKHQIFGTVSVISTRQDRNVSVHLQKLCKRDIACARQSFDT